MTIRSQNIYKKSQFLMKKGNIFKLNTIASKLVTAIVVLTEQRNEVKLSEEYVMTNKKDRTYP